MNFIVGILIFWITIIGMSLFVYNKFQIKQYFVLPIVFSTLAILMFIGGMLNILNLTSIIIITLSIGYMVFLIINKKLTLNKVKFFVLEQKNIIIILMFIFITILGCFSHVMHYDNFSHWALLVKNMFINSSLPNFDDIYIDFKNYQPGSACFIYFFGFLTGKTESSMIIAQNYLIFSYITIFFNFSKSKESVLKKLFPIVFFCFVTIISIKFNDLLVDGLLGVMSIASLAIIYDYKTDLKKATIYTLPILILLYLVKNTGIVLIGLSCLYIFLISIKNKEILKGVKCIAVIGLICLFTLSVWNGHVQMVYGADALGGKHSLTSENILSEIREKGWDNIFSWSESYLKHFVDVKSNQPLIIMIVIDLIIIVFAFFEKNKTYKKNILLLLLVINVIYVGYYVILGIMYIASMPWAEAVMFASYERYMSTILLIIVGMIILYIYEYKKINNNIRYLILATFIGVLISGIFYKENTLSLIGMNSYKGSLVEVFDNNKTDFSNVSNQFFIIYSPSSAKDGGYLYYLAKYKLDAYFVKVIYDCEIITKDLKGTILVMEPDDTIKNKLKEYNWNYKSDYLYQK